MRRTLFLVFLAACADSATSNPVALAPSTTKDTVDQIAADVWEHMMASEPRYATAIGDRRFDRELEDLSPDAITKRRAALRSFVERLAALLPSDLTAADRLNRDALTDRLLSQLALGECHYELWLVDHLDGVQSGLAELSTQHTTETLQQATELVMRYQGVPRLIDQHVANLEEGIRRGYVAPVTTVTRTIAQIDHLLAIDPSPFLPVFDQRFAADAEGKDREKAFEELVRAVRGFVDTSLVRYRATLKGSVLPAARKQEGVAALPFGAACYRAEIKRHTGLETSPQDIHALGLAEVGRIRGEMAALAKKLFPGKTLTLSEVAAELAKTQRFKTRTELFENAKAIVARAQAALPKAFATLPKTPIEVKRLEEFRERESPAAYYNRAPDDGSRPAYYYLNTFAPEDRPRHTQEALAFHEAVPGHHLQIALAQAQHDVPMFRRHLGQSAFVEGWALYAERLSKELSLYSDDASEYGRLGYELWRAQRLVVDTGLHAMGWTNAQAVAFMRDGATVPLVETQNEVDRYIAWPGQALAYKIGELEIRRLRAEAERALGKRFDLKAFHSVLLEEGALSLAIVRRRVEGWIAAQR